MSPDEARKMLISLAEEREELVRSIDEMSRREAGLAKVIEGISDLYPDIADQLDPQPSPSTPAHAVDPRGQRAVQVVLAEAAPNWLTIEDIAAEMVSRGWSKDSDDPVGATRAATMRLLRHRKVTRRKRGRSYAYRIAYGGRDSEALSETEGF